MLFVDFSDRRFVLPLRPGETGAPCGGLRFAMAVLDTLLYVFSWHLAWCSPGNPAAISPPATRIWGLRFH